MYYTSLPSPRKSRKYTMQSVIVSPVEYGDMRIARAAAISLNPHDTVKLHSL